MTAIFTPSADIVRRSVDGSASTTTVTTHARPNADLLSAWAWFPLDAEQEAHVRETFRASWRAAYRETRVG